jgi:hypothetical protein
VRFDGCHNSLNPHSQPLGPFLERGLSAFQNFAVPAQAYGFKTLRVRLTKFMDSSAFLHPVNATGQS